MEFHNTLGRTQEKSLESEDEIQEKHDELQLNIKGDSVENLEEKRIQGKYPLQFPKD